MKTLFYLPITFISLFLTNKISAQNTNASVHNEAELVGSQSNNTLNTAEIIPGFSRSEKKVRSIKLVAKNSKVVAKELPITQLGSFAETPLDIAKNDPIKLALDTSKDTKFILTGNLGDGVKDVFSTESHDEDIYNVDLKVGQTIKVKIIFNEPSKKPITKLELLDSRLLIPSSNVINPTAPTTGDPTPITILDPTAPISGDPTPITILDPAAPTTADPTPITILDPATPTTADPTPITILDPTAPITGDPTPITIIDPVAPITGDPTPAEVQDELSSILEQELFVLKNGTYSIKIVDLNQFVRSKIIDIEFVTNETLKELIRTEGGGDYTLEIEIFDIRDEDFYEVELKAGDLLGLSASGNLRTISLISDTNETIYKIPNNNLAQLLPKSSPLPKSGNKTFYVTISKTGTYFLRFNGIVSDYDAELMVTRYNLELNPDQKQIVYLNFAGHETTFGEFKKNKREDENPNKIITIKPMEDFLTQYGIEKTTFNRTKVASQITEVVRENLESLLKSNRNPNSKYILVSNYGSPYLAKRIPALLKHFNLAYSTLHVGGDIQGISVSRGIAGSIDFGNFLINDDAIIAFDSYTGTIDFEGDQQSLLGDSFNLNSILLAKGTDFFDLLAEALGNITTHEFGHLLGALHTEPLNKTISLMDSGGTGLFRRVGLSNKTDLFDKHTSDADFADDNYDENENLFAKDLISNVNDQLTYALQFNPKYGYGYKNLNETNVEELALKDLEQRTLFELENSTLVNNASLTPSFITNGNTANLAIVVAKESHVNITMYDTNGKLINVFYDDLLHANEHKTIEIDTHNLNVSGNSMYLLHIDYGYTKETLKLMVK
ncbi:T9SS type A sorting domain-containing protein [Aquimarina agarilytica]|uniref:T9SS type A sorting domain-containing protein n=1 Tax=Aquimarina agarilytica TaxID=1087449 RepID=UPI0002892487|nr:T9SS type A sorting domain-containing protein [Aquimarina agarilytica]